MVVELYRMTILNHKNLPKTAGFAAAWISRLASTMKTTALAEIIEREFSYLSARYGFGKLKVRDLGLEVFFEFDRGLETISVSVEIGSAPLIEIFVPAEETNEKTTPWAKKAGVSRARVLPKLDCSKQHNLKDLTAYESCIAEIAREFELSQEEWLHA